MTGGCARPSGCWGEQSRQVLLFTCQNREEYYLKQLKIPYHKIVLQEENT